MSFEVQIKEWIFPYSGSNFVYKNILRIDYELFFPRNDDDIDVLYKN